MKSPLNTHHQINYIEIPVTDLSKAKSFYGSAFGWQFNDYGNEYAGLKNNIGEFGRLSFIGQVPHRGRRPSPSPLVVLFSEDLEATLDSVLHAGGKLAKGPYPFPGGRRFEFLDTSGDLLAVWSEK